MSKENNSPQPNTEEAVSFLEKWSPDGPWVLTAINPENKNISTKTFSIEEKEKMRGWIDHRQGKCNIYFTVNSVFEALNIKPSKKDIRGMKALHVDVDPRAGEELDSERKRALKVLKNYHPAPSVIIDSGGGYQGFWILKKEHSTESCKQTIELLESYNLQVAETLQADKCHNIDRIMRLAGTINVPDKRKLEKGRIPRKASIVEAHWCRQYDLSEFPQASSKKAKIFKKIGVFAYDSTGVKSNTLSRIENLDELPAAVSTSVKALIVNGDDPDDPTKYPSRSEALFAVLCEMVRAGCSDEVMASIILDPDYGISAHILDQKEPQKYAERQILRAKESSYPPELAEMNSKHAVVVYGGRFVILNDMDDQMPKFLSRQDFENWYANRSIVVGCDKDGNPKTMPLAKWWLSHPLRRAYKKVEFLPGRDAPKDTYNLWRGQAVLPAEGDCSLYLELIHKVIASGDSKLYGYIVNWMALKFQRPELKLETSLVLRGGQGIGKSMFAELFGELFDPHFIAVTDLAGLTGRFNAHLQDALLVFADEIATSFNINSIGRLKSLVTQTHIRIEPKGVNSFYAKNYFSLIIASNNLHIVNADPDDRRWIVLDISPIKKGDHNFFNEVIKQWKNGGREAFAHFLLNRDLSSFEHRDKPQTAALTDQIEASFTGAKRVVHEMLISGETPDVKIKDRSCNIPQKDGLVFIPSGELARWAIEKGIVQRNETARLNRDLGRALKVLANDDKTDRQYISGKSYRGVWLPKLPKARKIWCEIHGRDFDWSDDIDGNWDVVSSSQDRSYDDPPF
jgi:hypothetical protein